MNDQLFVAQIAEYRSKLPPIELIRYGGIKEWLEDYDEAEIGHRHYLSLFGLYPDNQITVSDPTLFNAARIQLQHRIKHNSTHTGWSAAWAMCLASRLHDGDAVAERYAAAHRDWIMPRSLIAIGGREFQLDSTLGYAAAISECFLQSHETVKGDDCQVLVRLLPALPFEWARQGGGGHINGLKARGGLIVDLRWNARADLVSATIKSTVPLNYVITASKSRFEEKHLGIPIQVNGEQGIFVEVRAGTNDLTSIRGKGY